MDIPSRKAALRRATVERILAMDPVERRRQESELAERFSTLPRFAESRTVLLYVSHFPEEFDTRPLLEQSLALGKRVICPRVHRPTRRLRLYQVEDLDADLVPGMLGIPEPRRDAPEVKPTEIDWALIPGIAFDSLGFRLGRGAGHYDRLIPALRPDCPTWALALDPQWTEGPLPIEPHDQPLDGIVSPGRSIVVRSRATTAEDVD